MEAFVGILVLATPFIIYFIFKKIILGHFQKIHNKTGKNPINMFQQRVPPLAWLPFVFGCFNYELLFEPMVWLGIPALSLLLVFISNLHWIRPGRIVTMTMCHMVYGTMTVLRVLWWFTLCMFAIVQSALYGDSFDVTYNPFIILGINDEGTLTSYKKETYSFRPNPTPVPVMADLHKYTIDENISRRNIVIHQLENELDRIVTSKREAMIYGLDYSYYEQRETEINKQLSELRK